MHPILYGGRIALLATVALAGLASCAHAAGTPLYILPGGELSPERPTGPGFEEAIPTWAGPVFSNPGGTGLWRLDLPASALVRPTEARLWVAIDQPFVPPAGVTEHGEGLVACPLYLEQGVVDGGWYYYCHWTPFGPTGVVLPGTYEVVFTWDPSLPASSAGAGGGLFAYLATDASLAAAPTMRLLAGSAEHPSSVSFSGLDALVAPAENETEPAPAPPTATTTTTSRPSTGAAPSTTNASPTAARNATATPTSARSTPATTPPAATSHASPAAALPLLAAASLAAASAIRRRLP